VGTIPYSIGMDAHVVYVANFSSNDVTVIGSCLFRENAIGPTRGIPGLKRETWGTLRVSMAD